MDCQRGRAYCGTCLNIGNFANNSLEASFATARRRRRGERRKMAGKGRGDIALDAETVRGSVMQIEASPTSPPNDPGACVESRGRLTADNLRGSLPNDALSYNPKGVCGVCGVPVDKLFCGSCIEDIESLMHRGRVDG